MTKIAKYMAAKGYTLRSGGAAGADSAFELGADDRKEIYLPWERFNFNKSPLYPPTTDALGLAAQFHPAWDCMQKPARLLMGRNSHQVMGLDLKTPTERIICWTKGAKGEGGTGQAIRIARHHKIPVDDLANPKLLKEWTDLLAP
tara:strand:+ start:615 stop:1049 length:435 start_codon:yes stop_codon:yes gene_type:complete